MRISHPLRTASVLTLLIALSTSTVQADDTSTRLNFLNGRFNNAAGDSQLWQYGWFGLFSGVAAVNAVAWSQTEGKHNRYDRKVGFTTSFLGAADMLMNPMRTHDFAQQLSAMPEATAAQREQKLAQAEAWMQIAADRERYERSFLNHALSSVVNGLAGLAVAYDDKRPDDGWMTFVTGVIASEVKIYSAPEHMSETQWLYNSGKLTAEAAKVEQPHWQIAAFGPVLSASYRF